MPLTKPNQQLRRDLKAAASTLDDAAHDLFRSAKQCDEAGFLAVMEKIGKLHECIDKLEGYAEEVKVGRIERSKTE
ncbi:hypothetical protein [Pseudomonas sp.]|uniref:hypothetical protein n=1 Tax=Pseudomonas sp. TaxID=306 RepID=UPI003D6FA211